MALQVDWVVVGEVREGNEASAIDCTSDLLSSVGLPNACFVQVASLMVSLMLLTMNSLVGGDNKPALADRCRISLSLITDLNVHACCGGERFLLSTASFNCFLWCDLVEPAQFEDLKLPFLLMLKQSSGMGMRSSGFGH